MQDDRLPTHLYVDAHLRKLTQNAIPYYIVQKGAASSGTIILKITNPGEGCRVLQQQRNLDGEMGWMTLFKGETVEENEADAYIQRATDRDPDLWVIDIEERTLKNPFEGKEF